MEVENTDRGVRILHFLRTVGNVQRYQMPVWQLTFRGNNRINDAMLPIHRDTTEVWLVADFVVEVVESIQFANDLARQRLLDREKAAAVVQRIHVCACNATDTVDVVIHILRAELPLTVCIEQTRLFSLQRQCEKSLGRSAASREWEREG